MMIAAIVTAWVTARSPARTNPTPLRVALLCGAAYGSHILFDWLGTDRLAPFGIQALWPFSDQWYLSGWDIFPATERRRFFSAATILFNLKGVAQELLVLGPVLAVLWLIRVKAAARFPAEMAGRHHPAK
jgi:inner membrane protein